MRELRFAKIAASVFALSLPLGLILATPSGAAKAPAASATSFKGSYTGTLGLLMNGSSGSSATTVSTTSLSGKGTSTKLGASTISGTVPSVSATSQCTSFSAKGFISSPKGRLNVVVMASSKQSACAAATSTPTSVIVKGIATVISGTGVYARTSGTLSFSATFNVNDNTAGSTENDSFSATITGTLHTSK